MAITRPDVTKICFLDLSNGCTFISPSGCGVGKSGHGIFEQMTDALLIGSAVGALLGLLHAGYVYQRRLSDSKKDFARNPAVTRVRAGYYALWTFGLWVVFGSYVFYLWLLGLVLFIASKTIPKSRTA